MTVQQIAETLKLKVFSGESGLNKEVHGAYVSDLLSDVMGNAIEGLIWVTLQAHKNVMAVASLKDLSAVVIVKGIEPDSEMVTKSNEEGIPVLGTDNNTFEMSGKLYKLIV